MFFLIITDGSFIDPQDIDNLNYDDDSQSNTLQLSSNVNDNVTFARNSVNDTAENRHEIADEDDVCYKDGKLTIWYESILKMY